MTQAIERKNEEKKKIWLTYWIVFGMLTSIDDLFSSILNLIPGFYALRFIVYIWMFFPRANNGAQVIYQYLKPELLKWKVCFFVIKAKLEGFEGAAKGKGVEKSKKEDETKKQ